MPAVPLVDKAALICCVEYMRNSKKASPLISNLEKHKFDARAAVGDTFPGEELWISVSSTSNVDTLSLLPCHLVGYFNNAKWILQASQFERQARQLAAAAMQTSAEIEGGTSWSKVDGALLQREDVDINPNESGSVDEDIGVETDVPMGSAMGIDSEIPRQPYAVRHTFVAPWPEEQPAAKRRCASAPL